jgi:hypothetical protein
MTIEPKLADLFEVFPDLALNKGDLSILQIFRGQEPQLVACFDGNDEEQKSEVLVFTGKNKPLGIVSFVIMENKHKPYPKNKYARIYLVIVKENSRNLGVGRLLTLCAIIYLLRTSGEQLYSISCLAAHEAMETVLKDLSFQHREVKENDFWRGELIWEGSNLEKVTDRLVKFANQYLKQTNFKIRQRA